VTQGLGNRPGVGSLTADNEFNPDNWSVVFTPQDINVNLPEYEVYHMMINGPAGSSFTVWVDNYQWDNVQVGSINSWDPTQPLLANSGNTLYFRWNTGAGTAPTVTLFLRVPK
jgi:hypothetical protein